MTLRIGDPVQIDETTEVLVLVCLDGEYAWVRDGAGNHITHKLVDLVRARSDAFSAEGYAYLATLIRDHINKPDLGAILNNNFNVILGALDASGIARSPLTLTMWAEVVETYHGDDVEWRCSEESGRDPEERPIVELSAKTFPLGTRLEISEPRP